MLSGYSKGSCWAVNWKSTKRLFYYFKAINEGIMFSFPKGIALMDYDIVQSFFITCFHLKDWIKKDCKLGNQVESYVAKTRLNECRAIANGIKHLNESGPDFHEVRIEVKIRENLSPLKAVKFIVQSEGKSEDTFMLAEECLNLWHKFIVENIDASATINLE